MTTDIYNDKQYKCALIKLTNIWVSSFKNLSICCSKAPFTLLRFPSKTFRIHHQTFWIRWWIRIPLDTVCIEYAPFSVWTPQTKTFECANNSNYVSSNFIRYSEHCQGHKKHPKSGMTRSKKRHMATLINGQYSKRLESIPNQVHTAFGWKLKVIDLRVYLKSC